MISHTHVSSGGRLETATFYQSAPTALRCRRLGRTIFVVLLSILMLIWAVCQRAYIAQVIALVVKRGSYTQPTRTYRVVQAQYTLWTAFEYNITADRVTRLGRLAEFSTSRMMALVALISTVLMLLLAIALLVLVKVFEKQRLAGDAITEQLYFGAVAELRMHDQQRRFEQACEALSLTPDSQTLTPGLSALDNSANPLMVASTEEVHIDPTAPVDAIHAPPLSAFAEPLRESSTLFAPPVAVSTGPSYEAPQNNNTDNNNNNNEEGEMTDTHVVMGSLLDGPPRFTLASWPTLMAAPQTTDNAPVASSGGVVTVEMYNAHLGTAATAEYCRRSIERAINCALLALALAVDVLGLALAIHIHTQVVPTIEEWVTDSAGKQGPTVESLEIRSSPVGVLAVVSVLISMVGTGFIASGKALGIAWML